MGRLVKRLRGLGKVRYRGLQKNAKRAFTALALALANIYLSRSRLMAQLRP
jgi:IS5 family transposase